MIHRTCEELQILINSQTPATLRPGCGAEWIRGRIISFKGTAPSSLRVMFQPDTGDEFPVSTSECEIADPFEPYDRRPGDHPYMLFDGYVLRAARHGTITVSSPPLSVVFTTQGDQAAAA